ncbi:MAG: 4-hydroxy-2-oxovalerate aldolase [Rhodospirillales bacterium]|nr:4-hydroxy-2-oxovalerate aldolase [Rhodospirillales bacterium]
MYRPNRLLAALRRNEKLRAAWLFSDAPVNGEIMGLAGFDALLLDREHSAASIETCVASMRAIRTAGDSTILARAAENDVSELKRLLDAGVEGVLLANVESASEARHAVSACRYPPRGKRGMQYSLSRAAGWGRDADSYAATISDNLLIIAMIESPDGVAAIDEIAAVDGIDMLFIGPGDLSATAGHERDYDHPTVRDLIETAETRIKRSGKLLGGAAWPGHGPDALFARGYNFVSYTSDVALLRDAAFEAARK